MAMVSFFHKNLSSKKWETLATFILSCHLHCLDTWGESRHFFLEWYHMNSLSDLGTRRALVTLESFRNGVAKAMLLLRCYWVYYNTETLTQHSIPKLHPVTLSRLRSGISGWHTSDGTFMAIVCLLSTFTQYTMIKWGREPATDTPIWKEKHGRQIAVSSLQQMWRPSGETLTKSTPVGRPTFSNFFHGSSLHPARGSSFSLIFLDSIRNGVGECALPDSLTDFPGECCSRRPGGLRVT